MKKQNYSYTLYSRKEYEILPNQEQDYMEYMKNSPQYKDYRDLYFEMLINLTETMKNMGAKNATELSMFYDTMLKRGCLSVTDTYTKTDEAITGFEDIELLGPKITTGKGKCRHRGPSYTALCQRLNIKAYNIPLHSIYSTSKKCTHTVTGIEENNKKYLVDTDETQISIFFTKDVALQLESNTSWRIKKNRYKELNANSNKTNDLEIFLNLEPLHMTITEVENKKKEAQEKLKMNSDYMYLFKNNNIKLIKQIALLCNIITMPVESSGPIRKPVDNNIEKLFEKIKSRHS